MKAAVICRFSFACVIALAAMVGTQTKGWAEEASSACPQSPSYGSNFSSNQNCMALNSFASTLFVSNALQITNSNGNQTGSAWYMTPQAVQNGFTTSFTFQITNPSATPGDGIAFVIQNSTAATSAIGYTGGNGGALAYGDADASTNPSTGAGIPHSLAIEFDVYQNSWDGSVPHVAIQSCGMGPNTSHHGQSCNGIPSGGPTSTIGAQVLTGALADGNPHTVTITYTPANGETPANFQVGLDSNPALYTGGVPFDLTNIGLSTGGTAYVGFTAATGASSETQDIQSWTFTSNSPPQSVTAGPIQQGTPTTATFDPNQGQELFHTLEFPSASQVCTQNGVTNPELLSTNMIISNNGGIQPYTFATPWATGLLFEQEADDRAESGVGFGSLIVDECYQAGSDPSTASLLSCPVVNLANPNTAAPNQLINITELFDPPSPASIPAITKGTTVSLVHHPGESVSGTTSCSGGTLPATADWEPVPNGAQNNPVCTNVQNPGSNTYQCDLEDALSYDPAIQFLPNPPVWGVFGDQTGTGGALRSRGVIGAFYNIPMLTTQVSANGTALNSPGTQDTVVHYFNTQTLNLNFLVNPATTATPSNGWFAAPVNNLAYVFYNSTNQEPLLPAPPNCASPAPAGSTCMLQSGTPGAFTAGVAAPVDFTDTIANASIPSDGIYILAWSGRDTVDIGERYVQLITSPNAVCPNPDNELGNVMLSPPCYSTDLFKEQIGIDRTPPTITATLSPAAPFTTNGVPTYLLNQPVNVTYSCSDPVVNGASSGVNTCGAGAPSTLTTSAAGSFSFMANAIDNAGNQGSTTVSYMVVDQPADLYLLTLAPASVTHGSNLTYGIIGLNLGPNAANGVVVTAPIPSGTSLVKAVFIKETCTILGGCPVPGAGTPCVQVNNNVVCTIGSLNTIEKLTGVGIGITVSVPAGLKGQTLTESATITSLNRDPHPGDNTSSAQTKVK